MSSRLKLEEDIAWQLIVFISLFTPLQVCLVALRFYARSLTKRRYDLADLLVVVALVAQLVATGIDIGAVTQASVSYHLDYLTETEPEKITTFFKYLVPISIWYFATITITKLAICKLYLTIFPKQIISVILYITAFVLIATPVATTISLLAACRPFSANWGPSHVQNTHCLNKEAIFVWGTIPNIVTDVILLAVPLPVIWKLQVTTKVKLALSFTFIIGSLGLVASILRFISFFNTNSFTDATYNATELIIWTLAEPGIYLISASLLMYKPLLDKMTATNFAAIRRYLRFGGFTVAKSHTTSFSQYLNSCRDDGDRNIALGDRTVHSGFVQLGGNEDDYGAGQRNAITTDIQQSRDGVQEGDIVHVQ
ncbi:hypothetical protein F5Y07DRAFT_349786 [Xylaria sp. FL0933]|nr:hypothetical protein F5Y07DRAFT_349786 [Xylaria sp. FL0933]